MGPAAWDAASAARTSFSLSLHHSLCASLMLQCMYPHGLFVDSKNVHAACYFIFRMFISVLFGCLVMLFYIHIEAVSRAISLTCSNHFPLIEYFFSFFFCSCSFFTSSSFSIFLLLFLSFTVLWAHLLVVQKTYHTEFFAFFVLLLDFLRFLSSILPLDVFGRIFFSFLLIFLSFFSSIMSLDVSYAHYVYTKKNCFIFLSFSFRCKLLSLDDLWYGSQAIKIQIKKYERTSKRRKLYTHIVCTFWWVSVHIGSALLALANRIVCIALFCILPAHFVVLNLEIIEYASAHARTPTRYAFATSRTTVRLLITYGTRREQREKNTNNS